jgi:gliding motility-associated-like protein
MKKIRFLIFILLALATPSFAQKEAAIWYFGNNAGLDFNSGSPVALTNGQLITNEGCTTISDKNGKLLFYTDGSIVYDRTHKIMSNGFGLLGHRSSTQSAIIIPKPNDPNLYYIFTVDEPNPDNTDDNLLNDKDPPNNGLNYSIVDLKLNGGLGGIPINEKNIHLITYDINNIEESKFKCSEKITAVQHADGVSFWVITHFINNFYAFKISTLGVDKKPIQSQTILNIPIGGYIYNAIGYLKASPNGTKIAIANTAARPSSELGPKGEIIRNTGNVLLYDFDSDSGKVNNPITLLNNTNPYGLEFSAKSKKLYVTLNNFDASGNTLGSSLIQFDLKNSNIINSNTTINSSSYVAGSLQLGIDEKIYRSSYPFGSDGINKLSVINNPELNGLSCNYLQDNIDLKTGNLKLGLPPFITSLFLYTFGHEFNCLGQSTHFYINSTEKIDAVLWDFGDRTTSTNTDTYHTYTQPGDYKVTLIKTVNGENRDPIEKTITIYDSPKTIQTPYKLVQCDTQDNSPTDGLAIFNLSLANEPICLEQKMKVYYYHNINDAENDINNTKSITNTYQNTIPDEIIYAKVIQPNSSCYSIATVILHANKSILILPKAIHECDLGDKIGLFDLGKQKEIIKTELNILSNVKLFFYANENDSSLSINELEEQYLSDSKVLYIRAEDENGCYGMGKFDIIVEPTPKINISENKVLCEGLTNSPMVLDAGILATSSIIDFTYLWSTGETTPTITINEEGDYNVAVKNKSGCVSTRNCKVTLSHLARIQNIFIKDLQSENEITVEVTNPSDYKYMINFQNGTTTSFQNFTDFKNLPSGYHELIIENIDGCGQIKKNFTVLDVPKFFTPNADGYNDFWNLKGLNTGFNANAIIHIYDRYGKLLKQIPASSLGWDGTYNGNALPSDDYWFTVKLEDGRESKGHFSLKR